MDDKTIEIADYLLSNAQTYREARIACEKLFDKVAREIEHRALESEVRGCSGRWNKHECIEGFRKRALLES